MEKGEDGILGGFYCDLPLASRSRSFLQPLQPKLHKSAPPQSDSRVTGFQFIGNFNVVKTLRCKPHDASSTYALLGGGRGFDESL